MNGEISLDKPAEAALPEEEKGLLGNLEEKINTLLTKYQEMKKERDEFASLLEMEKEKTGLIEKKMELISKDREKVKARIDQLLLRLKGIDL
jgi:hypothetical protein